MSVLNATGTPWKPKTLAFELNASYPAVKMALKRMVEDGDVINMGKGMYISRHTVLVPANHAKFWTEKPLTLHGIKIVTTEREGLSSVTLSALYNHFNYTGHRHKVNESITFTEEWRGRLLTITFKERTKKDGNGYIEIFLRSSTKPVHFNEFEAFCGFIEGMFPNKSLDVWEAQQFGFNWDTQELRLEGVKAITLRAFKNVWLRLYQKSQDLLRVEAHVNVSLPLSEALSVLGKALDGIDETLKERVLVVTEDVRK